MIKNELIVIEDNELYVGTWNLAKGYEVTHEAVKKLVNRHKSIFERSGVVRHYVEQLEGKKRGTKAQGRMVEGFLLNEQQAMFLGTLLKNTGIALEFKHHLCDEFLRQRRAIDKLMIAIRNNKANAEWLEKRASGKIERRVETDAIKEFVQYAFEQGSKSAPKYYMAISKMENAALFHLELIQQEYNNLRDVVNGIALDSLKMADRIVAKALKDGMLRRMYYKDIFQLAKARVESFADSVGKFQVDDVKFTKSIGE